MAARTKVEENPQYSLATSKLLLLEIYREVFQLLEVINQQDALFITFEKAQTYYQQAFIRSIELGSQWKILNPELTTFDLNKLANALIISLGIEAGFPILKLFLERSVWAPQYLSEATFISPIVSFSIL